ncbi:SIR2 family NAD-dependent protein deacylase [Mesorhizobium sp. BH1-1-4]|uniref:SIR2 family NAD-dependent protein deacylase n=1 Tax=Mesorhizobium sp. BH1-1-4 TaxID=2876662 RepID=UPI001CD12BDF|nr:SIR2 family protein [Mesorhizobium sp. BH1-1-4]MBZ9994131.1 SIR2 family protein [Mesorhizobium sp. BH1-1-4]
MVISIHNPDRYMADLRTIVAQGRKRIGFLIGAGAAAGLMDPSTGKPLIAAVQGLTKDVLTALEPDYGAVIAAIQAVHPGANIETVLSRVRSLANVLGGSKVDGLDGPNYTKFSQRICDEIGSAVSVKLPPGDTPYKDLVNWIVGTDRDHPVEVFTTNYDLLLEEAFEAAHAPYFDGFTGGREPFFDPVSVATNDLPSRWTRLWKVHGSLGWQANSSGEVIRTGLTSATHLIYPEHLKYDLTQKAPYAALFDRLRAFLTTKDTLLISVGFSFADAHVAARVDESLAANPSASLFAFQYQELASEKFAEALAEKRPNFSVYARDRAIINGVAGDWRPGDPPARDWEPIRKTYWGSVGGGSPRFLLGDFSSFARFLVMSRSGQALDPPSAVAVPSSVVGSTSAATPAPIAPSAALGLTP